MDYNCNYLHEVYFGKVVLKVQKLVDNNFNNNNKILKNGLHAEYQNVEMANTNVLFSFLIN